MAQVDEPEKSVQEQSRKGGGLILVSCRASRCSVTFARELLFKLSNLSRKIFCAPLIDTLLLLSALMLFISFSALAVLLAIAVLQSLGFV